MKLQIRDCKVKGEAVWPLQGKLIFEVGGGGEEQPVKERDRVMNAV